MTSNRTVFWTDIVERANADPIFVERTRHLENCVLLFRIDAQPTFLEFHRGRAYHRGASFLRGARVTVSGPEDEWERLLSGSAHYMQAINPLQGKLRLEGDFLMANWAARGICAFFALATAHRKAALNA